MTTPRAPYKTRRWTDAEDAKLRSMVDAGHDAREIGKEINRSFMGVQTRAKKLKLVFAKRTGGVRSSFELREDRR